MRPLFAVAPLALLLALFAHIPGESQQTFATLHDRLFGAGTPEVLMRSHETNAVDTVVADHNSTLNGVQNASALDVALRR